MFLILASFVLRSRRLLPHPHGSGFGLVTSAMIRPKPAVSSLLRTVLRLCPLLLCLAAMPATSQTLGATVTAETAQPIPGVGHSYDQLLSETVDPSSGSVSIKLTLSTAPGRGIAYPLSMTYSSAGVFSLSDNGGGSITWLPNNSTLPAGSYRGAGGWTYNLPSLTYATWSFNQYIGPPPVPGGNVGGNTLTCDYFSDFTATDMDGQKHNLNLGFVNESVSGVEGYASNCPYNAGSFYTRGGDGPIAASLPGNISPNTIQAYSPLPIKVYDQTNGTSYFFTNGLGLPDHIEDRNGNQISFSTNTQPNPGFFVTDTAKRQSSITSDGISTDTISTSGLAYKATWTKATATYTMPGYTVPIPANSDEACSNSSIPTASAALAHISTLALPDSKSFKFYYGSTNPTDPSATNPYGLINEIIYPD